MKLNFGGLLVLGAGIVALALGINGSYSAFGKAVKSGVASGGTHAPVSEHKALSEAKPGTSGIGGQ